VAPTLVDGVTLHRLSHAHDLRGELTVGNFPGEVPFVPGRFLVVTAGPSNEAHAHRRSAQFLVALTGSCTVAADDTCTRQEFILDRPDIGLYLPPMTWVIEGKTSPDARLLVFASEPDDPNDRIRSYEELRLLRSASGQ
jgi:hypothetical protein